MKNNKIYIKLTKRDGTGPSIKKNLSSLSRIGQNLFKTLRKNSRINLIKNKMCKKIFKSIKEELTFYNKGMFNPYQIKADKLNIYLKQKTFKKTQVCFIFPVMSKNFTLRSKKEARNIKEEHIDIKSKRKYIYLLNEKARMEKQSTKRSVSSPELQEGKKSKVTIDWDDEYRKYENEMNQGNQTIMAQQFFYNVPDTLRWEDFIIKAEDIFGPVNSEEE